MEISEANIPVYVYQYEGHTIRLEKNLVERYTKDSRPVDETFMRYMLTMYNRENAKHGVSIEEISEKYGQDIADLVKAYR